MQWRFQAPCVPVRRGSDACDSIARMTWWLGIRQFAKGWVLYRTAQTVSLGHRLCDVEHVLRPQWGRGKGFELFGAFI